MTGRETRTGQLVSVPGPDGALLDGAWYPAEGATRAVLHVHGKGGNFYSGPGRFLPEADGEGEFAHLSLNMRCHDLGYTGSGVSHPDPHEGHVAVAGGMWERIAEGHHDLAAGLAWLRDRGLSDVVVVGHSSGGFYAAQACAAGAQVRGIGLLSPVLSHKRHMQVWFPDGQLDAVLEQAAELVERGRGHVLIPVPTWYYAISAASLLERSREPDEQLARHLARCRPPVLMLSGSQESRVEAWAAVMSHVTSSRSRTVVVPDVDHSYRGGEHLVAAAVFDFVRAVTRA